jgi:hypothetical protein
MKTMVLTRAVAPALLLLALPATRVASAQSAAPARSATDPISGEWAAAFEFAGGSPFTRTLKLKLEGTRVTGTAPSPRFGDGTVTGEWKAGELSLAIEGERGTMALAGTLKDGVLAGDWDVGHASGKWTAKRAVPAKSARAPR